MERRQSENQRAYEIHEQKLYSDMVDKLENLTIEQRTPANNQGNNISNGTGPLDLTRPKQPLGMGPAAPPPINQQLRHQPQPPMPDGNRVAGARALHRQARPGNYRCGLKNHEKPYMCVCSKRFPIKDNLAYHAETCPHAKHIRVGYLSTVLMKCLYCDKLFTHKRFMNTHIQNTHYSRNPKGRVEIQFLGNMQSAGEVDNFKAMQRSASPFVQHDDKYDVNDYKLRPDEKDNRYTCPYCVKRFKLKGTLRLHIRTHTGDQPYQCTICGKTFSQKGSAKSHVARLHISCDTKKSLVRNDNAEYSGWRSAL